MANKPFETTEVNVFPQRCNKMSEGSNRENQNLIGICTLLKAESSQE